MNSQPSLMDVIRTRKSWRKYIKKEIDSDTLKELRIFITDLSGSPFGGKCRFEILNIEDNSRVNQFASYGVIKNAPNYIAAIPSRSQYDIEHMSYLFEQVILKATYLNLGTCWLGGTIRREKVNEALSLEDNEKVPAITPLGYVDKHGLIGTIFRASIKAKTRKPWEELFFTTNGEVTSHLTNLEDQTYSDALEMVRLGPSAKNGQPWRIVKEDHKKIFHFYRADSAQYARMDIGIAVCHFHLALMEKGVQGDWIIQESNNIKKIIPQNWLYTITWIGE